MEYEEALDHIKVIHARMGDIKRENGGEWPAHGVIRLSPAESVALMTVLEIAGEL